MISSYCCFGISLACRSQSDDPDFEDPAAEIAVSTRKEALDHNHESLAKKERQLARRLAISVPSAVVEHMIRLHHKVSVQLLEISNSLCPMLLVAY